MILNLNKASEGTRPSGNMLLRNNRVTACLEIYLIITFYFALQIGGVTSFRVAFNIKFTQPCSAQSSVFARRFGIAPRECVAVCESRLRCLGVNYYRKRRVCELLLEDGGVPVLEGGGVPVLGDRIPGCVHVAREDITNARQCGCSENEACVTNTNGNQCEVKECGILKVQDGIVRGNINTIGAMRTYHCNHGYVAAGRTDNIKCLESGDWDLELKCLYDCGEPTSVKHASVSAGQTTAGSQRTYQCDPTYVLTDDKTATSITVTCLDTKKDWSRTNVSCIIVTLVGGRCNVDADCTNEHTQCIRRICFCQIYYQWNTVAKECTRRCTRVTDEFEYHEHVYINGYNDVTKRGNPSPTTCKEICLESPTCYHVEMWNKHCNLGNVNIEMVRDADPSKIRQRSTNGLYSRICA